MYCTCSLTVPPLHTEEGSGMAPLFKLFFSPEILGNINMQILRPQHDSNMQARNHNCTHLAHKRRACYMQTMCSGEHVTAKHKACVRNASSPMLVAFQQNNSSNGAVPDPSSLGRGWPARLLFIYIIITYCTCQNM